MSLEAVCHQSRIDRGNLPSTRNQGALPLQVVVVGILGTFLVSSGCLPGGIFCIISISQYLDDKWFNPIYVPVSPIMS